MALSSGAGDAIDENKLKINSENCDYRGEGNANIVVQLKEEKQVIRLMKNACINGMDLSIASIEEKMKIYQDYVKNVMQFLLGYFVADPVIRKLSADEIKIINKCLKGKRPANKLDRWLCEIPTLGVVIPDACHLPTKLSSQCSSSNPVLAVEIKPKQGFIQSQEKINGNPIVCRYCMKQSLKMKENSVTEKSGYCPLDLFSGCPARMSKAIRELLKTPQNNINIFKDQKVVFSQHDLTSLQDILCSFFNTSDENSAKEQLVALVIQALQLEFLENSASFASMYEVEKTPVCSNVLRVNCSLPGACSHTLAKGCVLSRILQAQQLGNSEVDLVYTFYTSSFHESNLYLKGCYPKCQVPNHMGLNEQHSSESKQEFQSRKVWEFLVSMTARDCSIIITFQQVETSTNLPAKHLVRDQVGNCFATWISVVDLDPKPVKRIEGVFRLNREMKEAYLNS